MAIIKTYRVEEAAQLLGVCKKTIYRYIKAGQIQRVKMGREYRITETALNEFIERGTNERYLDINAKNGINKA